MSLSVSVSSVGQTSFMARVSTSGSVAMQHYWYLDGNLYDIVGTSAGQRSSSCSFSGLAPGTRYSVRVVVYAFNPWRELDRGSTSVTTDEASAVAETYYAKLILNGNGGKTPSGYKTYERFTGWNSSWDGGADISISFYDPGFQKKGCTLIGWSTSPSASYPSYNSSDWVTIYSTRTSENNPATRTLYAVWSSGRPDNWSWWSNISAGSPFGMTAGEWNAFIDRIREFADYLGVSLSSSRLSAASAVSGTQMKASQANAVRELIVQLSPSISPPSVVNTGDSISAAFINGLKNALNSIP